MSKNPIKKMLGEERRSWILNYLRNSTTPVKGGVLAQKTNVSRQVIVNDITLLKARNEPIIATSQGYLYMSGSNVNQQIEKTVACYHDRSRTEEELNLIVDHGVTVKDVKVEHPVYGDLTASIMVSNRQEVQAFLNQMKNTNASLLSDLTSGVHIHTLIAKDEEQIQKAVQSLSEAGFFIKDV